MSFDNDKDFKIPKFFLSLSGLLLFENRFKRHLILCIVSLNWLSLCGPQVLFLAKKGKRHFDSFIGNIIQLCALVLIFITYMIFRLKGKKFQLFIKRVGNSWQHIKNKQEREILAKSSISSQFFSRICLYYILSGQVLITVTTFYPMIFDVLVPLNHPRPKVMLLYGDYIFFEQDDYHYWISLQLSILYVWQCCVLIGCCTLCITCANRICGLLDIVRLENLMNLQKESEVNHFTSNDIVTRKIKEVILLHKRTIRYKNIYEEAFGLCYLITSFLTAIVIAICATYMLFVPNDISKMPILCLVILAFLLFSFGTAVVGQRIIDKSGKNFSSAYTSEWYIMPIQCRKSIGMIMLRAIKPLKVTGGKLVIMNMETFLMMIKSASSYVMMLRSLN